MDAYLLEVVSPPGLAAPGGLVSYVDGLAVVVLAAALLLVATYRLSTALWLLAGQSLALAALAFGIAAATGAAHVYVAALLTVLVKVVVGPLLLARALQRARLRREVSPVVPTRLALLLALGLVLLAYRAAGEVEVLAIIPSRHALPISLALTLIGLLLMIGRRKALSQVIGLITMENGIYLAALVATYGLPLAVELGVFFDLLVGVIVMGVFVRRMSDSFDSMDTDRLQRLRW